MTREPAAAVLFDFGGTLDSDGLPWKARFHSICAELHPTLSAREFDPLFYELDDALVGSIPPSTGLEETVMRLSCSLAERLGRPREGISIGRRFLGPSLRHLRSSGELLRRLSERFRIGIVSNFYGNLEAVCEEAGIARYAGAMIDSAVCGFSKPDRRIFDVALARLGVDASEATFIGDSLERDMVGARAAGMRHVWLAPADRAASSAMCCPSDCSIRRIEQIEELLHD